MTARQLVLCLIFLAAVPLLAQDAGPPSAAGIVPTYVAGNPRCEDLGLDGCKIDPPTTGASCGGVTIMVDGRYIDWVSEGPVLAVLVKGGPNAALFEMEPPGLTADQDLHAPVNPNNGQLYGLSHVSFCGIGLPPPPPPPPFCGDGNVDPGEGCDDGNTTDGDGCSATCIPETPTLGQWGVILLALVLLAGGVVRRVA